MLDRKLGCRSKTSKKDKGFAQCLEYLYRQEHPMIVESMFINVVVFLDIWSEWEETLQETVTARWMYGTCVIESVATKQGFWNIEKANSISSKPKWCEQVTCMHWLEQFFAFGFLIRFTHIKSEQEYSPTLFLVHVPCYAFGNVLASSRRINKKKYIGIFLDDIIF